jgi:hypothetical protein
MMRNNHFANRANFFSLFILQPITTSAELTRRPCRDSLPLEQTAGAANTPQRTAAMSKSVGNNRAQWRSKWKRSIYRRGCLFYTGNGEIPKEAADYVAPFINRGWNAIVGHPMKRSSNTEAKEDIGDGG